MNEILGERPTNTEIIDKYLEHYQHSKESMNMRKSSLNYFFGEEAKKCFGYQDHVFNLDTSILIDYFNWLKNLDLVSIETRRNKWKILSSFLQYTMEYYNGKRNGIIKSLKREGIKNPKKNIWDEFIIIIPSKTVDWKGAIQKNGKKQSNAKVFAEKEEIERLLQYFKRFNFKHYLIFRIFTDTGMRKGTLINLKLNEVYLDERYFHPKISKTEEKIYPFPEDLQKLLRIYVNNRKEIETESNEVFLNKYNKKYSKRVFNLILQRARAKLGIEKRITTKTFRKTLNDYRKGDGCSLEDREMLIGHKTNNVNIKNYTRADIERHIETYDKHYPYEDLNF